MKQNEYQRSAASVARRWRGKLPLLLLAILGMSGAVARGDWVATGGSVTNYTLNGTNYTAHVFLAVLTPAIARTITRRKQLITGIGSTWAPTATRRKLPEPMCPKER